MRRAESKTAKTMMPRACLLIPCLGCFLALPMVFTAVSGQTSGVNSGSGLPPQVPTPADNLPTPEKISLGKQLFFDPRLSGDDRMSCATCHVPEKAFTDGFKTAKGAAGRSLKRNTQSLLNVGLYSVYFWDGRAGSLEQQALAPIAVADEMNQDLDELVRELSAVPAYVKQFQSAFGTGVTKDGIAKALAAFERTLVRETLPSTGSWRVTNRLYPSRRAKVGGSSAMQAAFVAIAARPSATTSSTVSAWATATPDGAESRVTSSNCTPSERRVCAMSLARRRTCTMARSKPSLKLSSSISAARPRVRPKD